MVSGSTSGSASAPAMSSYTCLPDAHVDRQQVDKALTTLADMLTHLSDGGDTVRDLQLYLHPDAEHLLDWFHISMRLTVLQQTAKGLPQTTSDGEETYVLRDTVVGRRRQAIT